MEVRAPTSNSHFLPPLTSQLFASVCGTDLHAYCVPVQKFPTQTEAVELSGEKLPITLGHEYVPFFALLNN